MRYLFLLLALFLAAPCFATDCTYYTPTESYTAPTSSGTTYYVDTTNGSDTYNGLAATYTTGSTGPWKTLAKAFDRYTTRGVGTRILIRAGHYYERVSIPNTWTYGTNDADRLVVAAYGDGEVVIDGSIHRGLGAWSVHSGSIYKSTFTTPAPDATGGILAVAVDDDFRSYHFKMALENVTSPGDWYYDQATTTLYLYAVTGDPTGKDVCIVNNSGRDANQYAITVNPGSGKGYVTLDGLTVRGWPAHAVYGETGVGHITINRCVFKFNGKSALWTSASSQYTRFTKNYVYGNVIYNWPRGAWDGTCYNSGGWPSAVFVKDGYGLVSGNVIAWNGGEGVIVGNFPGYHTVENNIVHDNWSMQIYPATTTAPIIRNNVAYSSGPHDADSRNNTDMRAGWATCSTNNLNGIHLRLRGDGIASADEADAVSPYYSGGQIYNNLVVYLKNGIAHFADNTNSGVKDVSVYNNTIITPFDEVGSAYQWTGFNFSNTYSHNSNSSVKNNIVLAQGNGIVGRYLGAGQTDSGVTFDYNLFYHNSNSTPISYKGTDINFTSWQGQTPAKDANGQFTAPLLTRTAWDTYFTPPASHGACWTAYDHIGLQAPSDVTPQATSPAVDTGANTGLPADFSGNARPFNAVFDLGAIEYGAGPLSDLIAPSTIANKTAGRYQASQLVTLLCSDNVACFGTHYCFGDNCTPSITYSTPFKVLQNIARQVLRFRSVDASSNEESIKESVFTKQRRK